LRSGKPPPAKRQQGCHFRDLRIFMSPSPQNWEWFCRRYLNCVKASSPAAPSGISISTALSFITGPALVTKAEYLQAWQLTQELTEEILKNEKYCTIKRREHGLGLELFTLSDEKRRAELILLKKKYDPQNIFNPHLFPMIPKSISSERSLRSSRSRFRTHVNSSWEFSKGNVL